MSISHFIVHQISAVEAGGTALNLGFREIALSKGTHDLIDKLKGAYLGRLGREHGSFAKDLPEAPLPKHLDAYLNKEITFLELTVKLMEKFKTLLDGQGEALDGHPIFFLEDAFDGQFLNCFIPAYKTAYTTGDDLQVEATSFLDFGASLFGVRINITEWKEHQNYTYLSLMPPRGNKTLNDVFTQWCGFGEGVDKVENTHRFLEGVEAFAPKVPEAEVSQYRNQVVDFCVEQNGRDAPVDLGELSRSVDSVDSEQFAEFMTDYAPQGEGALRMDPRGLKKYVKFTGREKDLAISFSSDQLNSRVHYNQDKDTLSIEGIPKALRDQLLAHLNVS